MRLMSPPNPECARVHAIEGGWIVTLDETASHVEIALLRQAYDLETHADMTDDAGLVLVPTSADQPMPTTEAVRETLRRLYRRVKVAPLRLVKCT